MTTDQWMRGLPNLGIGIVLLAFGLASWVRAHRRRNGEPCWPVPWPFLSSFFLLALALATTVDALRLLLDQTERYEHRAVYAALWLAFGVSAWTFWRWWGDGE